VVVEFTECLHCGNMLLECIFRISYRFYSHWLRLLCYRGLVVQWCWLNESDAHKMQLKNIACENAWN